MSYPAYWTCVYLICFELLLKLISDIINGFSFHATLVCKVISKITLKFFIVLYSNIFFSMKNFFFVWTNFNWCIIALFYHFEYECFNSFIKALLVDVTGVYYMKIFLLLSFWRILFTPFQIFYCENIQSSNTVFCHRHRLQKKYFKF